MMDPKPATDCPQTDKSFGPSRPAALPPSVREDLHGESRGNLVVRLDRVAAFLEEQEQMALYHGADIRAQILNEHISTLREITARVRAALARKGSDGTPQ
jgi:hypothetical protein